MTFIFDLFTRDSAAHTLFILGLVIVLGLILGSLRFRGISLGVAGVLFSGLLLGHLKVPMNAAILEFGRELGLILFVYTIGLQVGPGFFASIRREGLRLNILAACVVTAGALLTAAFHLWGGLPLPAAAGIFSGATTNTPSLAAAQQALKEFPGMSQESILMPALGYAVSYPFGIIGMILSMILLRFLFRIEPLREAESYSRIHEKNNPKLAVMDFKIENPEIHGLALRKVSALNQPGVVISRVIHEGAACAALPNTVLHLGDTLRAVGPAELLGSFKVSIGSETRMDFRGTQGHLVARRVIVSRAAAAGRTIAELAARQRYGVSITRILRSDVELPVTPELVIHYADEMTAVGKEEQLKKFASDMGDSVKELHHPQLISIFAGIVAGIVVGMIPLSLPGIPSPVKLGLAGGPLVVAILLSRVGRWGPLLWYMPPAANTMLREMGIALFLACVGLMSGGRFAETLMAGQGAVWMAAGAAITVLPIFFAALWARLVFKMNYLTLCGFLAGSMTDPPALAFANQMAPSGAQVVSYAAVYPAVMILRVIAAQCLVIFLMR